MKKIVVLLAAFSFAATVASAQTAPAPTQRPAQAARAQQAPKTPEQKADRAAQHLTKKLGLSAAQTEQVRQLHLARIQQQQARKAARAQYDAQLKQILSAEQYAKYTQLQAERLQKRKARHQSPQQGKS
ncbi:hypothetical protein [Hymenobacter weizhouensis]|uniref:hypothetical protein n=1 Tax=Hymenobacter sp. YIM 151500-1 TaxID=2987689 RepID=UPI002226FDC3|nr:hypothetical protein [Hymenobacter sp. YIM 151500-1]UYZ64537.1 hypothetical protein OIS53_06725 [Hymenobacter sp. YIM 151500-1]